MDDFGVNNLFNEDDEPEMQVMPVTENKKKAALVSAFDWLDSIVVSVIAVVLIFTFLFRVVGIVGDSMNLFYTPKVGDIVVISRNATNNREDMHAGNEPIIKRVIAVEGDSVDIRFEDGIGYVYVNGVLKNETYIKEYISDEKPIINPISFPAFVPDGCIFVLGDNRNESLDSRSADIGEYGMIDTRYVLGKAVLRLFPFDKIRRL